MKSAETLRWVAAARPPDSKDGGRYGEPGQRSLLLSTILAEDRLQVPEHGPSPVDQLPRLGLHRRRRAVVAGVAAIAVALVVVLTVGTTSSPSPRRLSLPTIVIKQPSLGPISLPEPVYPYLMNLTVGSGLTNSPGSEPVYRISWPMSAQASAVLLAHVFGVTGGQTDFVEGGTTFGPPAGPAVEVTPQEGILNWTYEGSPTDRCPLIGRSPCGQASAPPSDSWATAQSQKYLASLGLTSALGQPYVSNFRGQVGVDFPVELGSLEANEQFDFIYGPGGTLEMATGVFGKYALVGNYPTMSAVAAVGALESETHYAPRDYLTDCPKNSQGTPVCSGTVTSANLGFRYASTVGDGELLIPQWFLQGPEVGDNPDAKTIGGVVPALDPIYVRIETPPNGQNLSG
jgi:hypothetical protein